jgi:hypothetical protein
MWESLPDEYTLMDIAYIYTWKRVSFVSNQNIPNFALKSASRTSE